MSLSCGRPAFLVLGIGTAGACLVATAGAVTHPISALWRAEPTALQQRPPVIGSEPTAATGSEKTLATPDTQSALREATMTPLADRREGRERAGGSASAGQANQSRPRRGDDADDDHPRAKGPFRTVCVRLCDGYFFPLNFAVTSERLERDNGMCERRCGGEARLFMHPSGSPVDDMVDLQGRPYRELPTAFLYRTQYVASCKCQADPWESAALDRHRAYELAEEAGKGNQEAAEELQTLQAKLSDAGVELTVQEASVAGVVPVVNLGLSPSPPPAAPPRQAAAPKRDGGHMLGLSSKAAPRARSERKSEPVRADHNRDWIKRAFEPYGG
jgi:hypothetical protein